MVNMETVVSGASERTCPVSLVEDRLSSCFTIKTDLTRI